MDTVKELTVLNVKCRAAKFFGLRLRFSNGNLSSHTIPQNALSQLILEVYVALVTIIISTER